MLALTVNRVTTDLPTAETLHERFSNNTTLETEDAPLELRFRASKVMHFGNSRVLNAIGQGHIDDMQTALTITDGRLVVNNAPQEKPFFMRTLIPRRFGNPLEHKIMLQFLCLGPKTARKTVSHLAL